MKSFRQYLKEFDTTTQYHTELNPAVWDGEKLRPAIRTKLLAFADAWASFANIPANLIQDVHLVGGNAGYNYTGFSDLDVHLIVDRDSLGNRQLVDEYLQTKKNLWGFQHHVKIAGFPVEGYVQDPSEKAPKSQGVYSLTNDKWVIHPEHPPSVDTESKAFKSKVTRYVHHIESLINKNAPLDDFKVVKDRLKRMRSAGLAKGGEYDMNNILFKELRNLGILDRMNAYVSTLQDSNLSL